MDDSSAASEGKEGTRTDGHARARVRVKAVAGGQGRNAGVSASGTVGGAASAIQAAWRRSATMKRTRGVANNSNLTPDGAAGAGAATKLTLENKVR